MKKTILYSAIVLLIVIITLAGTYAFINTAISNSINPNSAKIDIAYSKGTTINGSLNLVNNKEEGLNTTISIGLNNDSLLANANIYIDIEEISEKLATSALKWEVYRIETKIENETEIEIENHVKSGNFTDCINDDETKRKCQTGDKLYIENNYELTKEPTTFKIYIWLDGNIAGNEVIGTELIAHIGAETDKITSIFE